MILKSLKGGPGGNVGSFMTHEEEVTFLNLKDRYLKDSLLNQDLCKLPLGTVGDMCSFAAGKVMEHISEYGWYKAIKE